MNSQAKAVMRRGSGQGPSLWAAVRGAVTQHDATDEPQNLTSLDDAVCKLPAPVRTDLHTCNRVSLLAPA